MEYFQMQALETVTMGAEALDLVLVESFFSATQHTTLYNLYGPTETTIQVAAAHIYLGLQSVPVGHAVYNTSHQHLMGEFVIGGVQVGQGYMNLPGRTASSFTAGDDDRVYHTGDVVRQDAKGYFHFLRRKGMQVKVRGFRVELGEIEAVGKAVESIVDFAVTTVSDASGRFVGLVGFYVEKVPSETSGVAKDISRVLEASLPHYMVPQRMIKLDALPKNASMKVDRKRLTLLADDQPQECEANKRGMSEAVTLPFSQNQELVRVWERVLNQPSIKCSDDTTFFDVGGDSVSAIRLVSAIQEAFPGVRLTVKEVLLHPTLAKMWEIISLQQPTRAPRATGASLTSRQHELDLVPGSRCLYKVRHSASDNIVVCFPGLGWLGGEFQELSAQLDGYSVYIAQMSQQTVSLPGIVRDISGEIGRLPAGKLTILGHSMGGRVAQEICASLKAPRFLDVKVVMVDTHVPADSTSPLSDTDIERVLQHTVGKVTQDIESIAKRFMKNAKTMQRWESRGELATVLKYDVMVRADVGGSGLAEDYPDRTYVIQGADHFSILQQPFVEEVVKLVRVMGN
jgi:thioesterase domain-containing protein/acyl carrier protein